MKDRFLGIKFFNKVYKSFIVLYFIIFSIPIVAQDSIPKYSGDLKYREDQFYIGITYNLLISNTNNISSQGLSGGLNFGFIRDMPINKKRNISFGAGAGFSFDQYGSNLQILKNEESQSVFNIISNDVRYKYNRLQTATIEAPIEFRWRTSSPTSYKFWRVHLGFRIGYTFWYRSRFNDYSNSITNSDIDEFEKIRFGTTLSLGYNKFNLFAYYGLNQFFNEAQTSDHETVDYKNFNIGLIFYIL
ncbi:MAG: porin family protein [Flavobacteriaceae bacterium]